MDKIAQIMYKSARRQTYTAQLHFVNVVLLQFGHGGILSLPSSLRSKPQFVQL